MQRRSLPSGGVVPFLTAVFRSFVVGFCSLLGRSVHETEGPPLQERTEELERCDSTRRAYNPIMSPVISRQKSNVTPFNFCSFFKELISRSASVSDTFGTRNGGQPLENSLKPKPLAST
jgi:hypothetical protein